MNTSKQQGFSILELAVVIVLIGLLSMLVTAYMPQAQMRSRDTERTSDIATLKNYLEQQYVEKASASYPTYPSTSSLTSDLSALTSGGLLDSTKSPGSNSSSIITASSNGDQTSVTTKSSYIYQPYLQDGSLCTTSSANQPCVRFKLWYKLEENSPNATFVESLHQQ
ncbi:MAG: type II secretion system protein [Candidatus Saccharimonadales bacterium]